MTANEAIAVFRHGLNDELGLAMAGRHEGKPGESERTARVLAAMYRAAARMAPGSDTLPDAIWDEQTTGFPAEDKRTFALNAKGLHPGQVAWTLRGALVSDDLVDHMRVIGNTPGRRRQRSAQRCATWYRRASTSPI